MDERGGHVASNRSPFIFFMLVFAFSAPLYLVGAITRFQVIPGVPLSGLVFVCPTMAALFLVLRENGKAGVIVLLMRSIDWKSIKGKIWFAPMIFLAPFAALIQYGITRWTSVPIPMPQFPIALTLILALALLTGALCEELGWSGYAIDPLQDRLGELQASILVGFVWAVWHFVPLVQVGRSPVWIAWWCLGTVALRVLIVWLYNNTGKSVFAAAVLHAMSNLAWQLFPINGSFFDVRINAVLMTLFAFAIVVVWEPRKLAG